MVTVRRAGRWDRRLFWGFMVSMALVRAGHAEERDPYWQIRAGAENLAGIPLARPDTWSWSGVEGDWYPNSPLWNMLLALAYQLAGFWGFFLLSAATIVLLVSLIETLGRRLGARPLPALVGLMVVFAAAFPMLSARATLAVQVLLLFAIWLVLRIAERLTDLGTAALTGLLLMLAAALSTLGNWIHLSFLILAPALSGVWALVWLLTPDLTTARRWSLILGGGVGWLVGPVLSPYGLITGLERSRAVQEACAGLLLEWRSPLSPDIPFQFQAMGLVAVLLATGGVWWLVGRWRARRPSPTLAALVVLGAPAALAGVMAIRFIGVALLVLAPVVAAAITHAVDRVRVQLEERVPSGRLKVKVTEYSGGTYWRTVLTLTLAVISPGVLFFGAQHGVPAEQPLISRMPAGCRMFGPVGIGSAIVLLRPDIPVWMDGRADFFGRDLLIQTYTYYLGKAQDVVPDGTTCVVLDRSAELGGLVERIESSRRWRLADQENGYELWLPAN